MHVIPGSDAPDLSLIPFYPRDRDSQGGSPTRETASCVIGPGVRLLSLEYGVGFPSPDIRLPSDLHLIW